MPVEHVRTEGRAGRMGHHLMSVVAAGDRRRIYRPPSELHRLAARVERPPDVPDGALGDDPRAITPPNYGLGHFADIFTDRQLLTLTTLSDLVLEVRARALRDAIACGLPPGARLDDGGTGAEAYADAVATYLSLAIGKHADYGNSLVAWYPQEGRPSHLFTLATISMGWDFCEVNPWSDVGGAWSRSVTIVAN